MIDAVRCCYSRRNVSESSARELTAHVRLAVSGLEALLGVGAHGNGQSGEGEERKLHARQEKGRCKDGEEVTEEMSCE